MELRLPIGEALLMAQNAARHLQQPIAPFERAGISLQRGRSAAEQKLRAGQLRQLLRCLAGVVHGRLALLVAAVLLFIQHDEAQTWEGREQRRARSHEHLQFPTARPPPRVVTLAFGHGAVPDAHFAGEAQHKAAHGLRREADLRHEDERLPALRQYALGGPQIDFGLAGAGHAEEQRGRR